MSLISSNSQVSNPNHSIAALPQESSIEFCVHNGSIIEKKSVSETQSLLLQQRFITTNHLLKPCIPFLPPFSININGNNAEQQHVSTDNSGFPTKSSKSLLGKKSVHVCDICSKEFKTQSLLRKHSALHEPNIKHDYKCLTCGKCFGRKTGLRRHELCHTSLRPHICEECGKGIYKNILFSICCV